MIQEITLSYTNSNKIEIVLSKFLNWDTLPTLMQGVIGAVITLQIAFAIAVFTDILTKKDQPGGVLDLHVVLDYIWRFKLTCVMVLCAFVIPFFFSSTGYIIKSIWFALWIIAFVLVIRPLFNIYNWVKGNRDTYRYFYLNSLNKGYSDMEESWKSYWTQISQSVSADESFFKLFVKKINKFWDKGTENDIKMIEILISDFWKNLPKRSVVFVGLFDLFFKQVLLWHYKLWLIEKSSVDIYQGDKIESAKTNLSFYFNEMIRFITTESLDKSRALSYPYFKHLKEHLEDVIKKDVEYVENFPAYKDILSQIPETYDSYDIWRHNFPHNWKITKVNLQNEIISRVWLNEFLQWFSVRISDILSGKYKKQIDRINMELFPTVNPIWWARILVFVFAPWKSSRADNVFEDVPFGNFGRMRMGTNISNFEHEYKGAQKEEDDETINLALYIFKDIFTRKNIEEWLHALRNIEIEKNSPHEAIRNMWNHLLHRMLRRLPKSPQSR